MRHERITIDPAVMVGKPCIKGTRLTVELILSKLAAGLAYENLLADHPRLTREDILAAIKGTAEGRSHVDPAVAHKLLNHVRTGVAPDESIVESLSEREQEVLRLLAHGLTNTEIAEKLFLAEGTVRNYVSAIRAKLNVTDRTQAAAVAWRYGLVKPNDDPTGADTE